MRSLEKPTEWFLIDWEYASFFPTSAIKQRFNPDTHCPTVFEPNHGCEVDIWAVGKLLCTCTSSRYSLKDGKKIRDLGEKIMKDSLGASLNATRALEMVLELQKQVV
jgi:hypothetical protein